MQATGALSRPGPQAPVAAGCQDPALMRAFEQLRSCNYRQGVLDYQCPARKALERTLRERERENRARVQLTLEGLLDQAEERVRLAAVKRLAPYAVQRGVLRLFVQAYRKERSPYVRAWLVQGLRPDLPEARRLVLEALQKDPAPAVRTRAALRLGSGAFPRSPATRQALVLALQKDKSLAVRQQAAEALGRQERTAEVESLLISRLDDPGLGPHCALGLARLASKPGLAALWKRLRTEKIRRAVPPVLLWALVEYTGAPFANPAEIMKYVAEIAKDAHVSASARHFAVRGLGRLATVPSERTAAVTLLKSLAKDRVVGVSAKSALSRLERTTKGRSAAHK